jgi:hypothetical protein
MSRRHRRRDPVAQEMRDLAIWTSLTPGQQKQPKWQRRIEGWRRVYQLCIEAGLPMRLSFTKPSLIGPALSGSTVSTVNRGVWWSGAKHRAWCRSLNVSPIPMASQC